MTKGISREKLEIAKELYYKGKSLKQIGEEADVSISAVQRYADKEKWKRHPNWIRYEHNHVKRTVIKISRPTTMRKMMDFAPPVNEHSMLDSCKRLMWILKNDSGF